MLAAVILENISEIAKEIYHDDEFSQEAKAFAEEVRAAIDKYAMIPALEKPAYAYEVDGFGQYNIMDDANLPSLLSMPYIGYCDCDDERYLNTRSMILSEANPFYYSGKCAKGIGSPHTPPRYIWHIALSMQALTSASDEERAALLKTLETTDGGTGFMHEGFHVDNPKEFTRPWFSWANSVFCEFILDYCGCKLKL